MADVMAAYALPGDFMAFILGGHIMFLRLPVRKVKLNQFHEHVEVYVAMYMIYFIWLLIIEAL